MSTTSHNVKQLTCTDRTGQVANFAYTVETSTSMGMQREWTYRVRSLLPDEQYDFFELKVVELDSGTVRVVMLSNNRYPPVSGKGIFDALIPRVAAELSRRVQSSPANGPTADIRRSEDATKAWQRLVLAGKAHFEGDIFFVDKPTA